MPDLVVIYGPPMSGKSSVARELARSFSEKTALVSVDGLLRDAIVVPDRNALDEIDMVHTQARLLVANYLKNRYHVVAEGCFYYEQGEVLHRFEQEIDQLVALMRNLARTPLLVRLGAAESTLRQRAAALKREAEVDGALRIDAEYKPRYGERSLHLHTDHASAEQVAEQIRPRLETPGIA